MRILLSGAFGVSLILTLASFGGALHGLGDSLAVFRVWFVAGLCLCSLLLLRRHWRMSVLGGAVVLMAVIPVLKGSLAQKGVGQERYSLYQKNMLFDGTDRDGIVADILAEAPDFVTLEEVSPPNKVAFDSLTKQFPSYLYCPNNGVAVLSSYPLVPGSKTCIIERGVAALQVISPDGPLWVVALHLRWPYPHGQRAQVNSLLAVMDFGGVPVVLGGDFNMVPWSDTMRRIQQVTGSQRAGRLMNTYRHERWPLRLPIDHILVPGGRGTAQRRPLLGSDHYGLLLQFDLSGERKTPANTGLY